MSGAGRRNIPFRAILIAAAVVGLPVLCSNGPAQAQGFFDFFNRIFGGFPAPPNQLGAKNEGPTLAYCVRLCDGRYFPLSKNAGAPHSSPDKICSSMCPASATKIYSGSGIDDARAEDGAAYSKLENAFAYRERVIPDCTCTGKDIVGTVALDVYSDPTLRPGDIIVTKEGPKVFSGSERAQYRTAEFVPPENYKGLPAGVRRTLAEMRVAPELNIALADFAAQPAVPARRRLPTLAEETGHIPLGHLGLQVP